MRWILFIILWAVFTFISLPAIHFYVAWIISLDIPKWVNIFIISPIHIAVFLICVIAPIYFSVNISKVSPSAGYIIMILWVLSVFVSIYVDGWPRNLQEYINLFMGIASMFYARPKSIESFTRDSS
ncbi:MAG: hypothetical protein AABY93_03630 [Bacteroidota bacterium]